MKYNWHHVLAGDINRARFVERYGSFPHIHVENVAEHSYFVGLYAYMIWQEADHVGDLGEILARAMFHDMEESVTGDMLRAVKYSSSEMKKAMDEAGEVLLDELLKNVQPPLSKGEVQPHTAEVKRLWSEAKDDTFEGCVVALADLLSVVSYAHIERQFGNRHAARIVPEITENLRRLSNKLQFGYHEAPATAKRKLINVIEDVVSTILMEYPHEGNPR